MSIFGQCAKKCGKSRFSVENVNFLVKNIEDVDVWSILSETVEIVDLWSRCRESSFLVQNVEKY